MLPNSRQVGISSILSSDQLDTSLGLSQRQLTWAVFNAKPSASPMPASLSASPYPRMPLPSNQWLNLCHHMLCHLNHPCLIPRPTTSHWRTLKCFENFLFSSSLFQFWNWFWSNSLLHCVLRFYLILHSTTSRLIFLKYGFAANFWSFLQSWVWGWILLARHSGAFEIRFSIWLFFPLLLLLNCLYSSNARIYSCIYIFFLYLWICLFPWNSLLFPLQPSLLTLTLTFKIQFKFHIP